MINSIIIDDEPKARETIGEMLLIYCKNINIIGQADSVESGIKAINTLNPDLVFLDIKLPDGSGFDILKHFYPPLFKVIFITAYDDYAIQAFKFSAVDYVLKPIDPDDLIAAVGKVEEAQIQKEDISMKLNALFSNYSSNRNEEKKIVLKTQKSIHVISVKDIVRCEADQSYTTFILTNGNKIMVSKTIKEFDEMLSLYGFYRIHQSHLINLSLVDYYEKGDGGLVIMKDKSSIPVSQRKKDDFLNILNKI